MKKDQTKDGRQLSRLACQIAEKAIRTVSLSRSCVVNLVVTSTKATQLVKVLRVFMCECVYGIGPSHAMSVRSIFDIRQSQSKFNCASTGRRHGHQLMTIVVSGSWITFETCLVTLYISIYALKVFVHGRASPIIICPLSQPIEADNLLVNTDVGKWEVSLIHYFHFSKGLDSGVMLFFFLNHLQQTLLQGSAHQSLQDQRHFFVKVKKLWVVWQDLSCLFQALCGLEGLSRAAWQGQDLHMVSLNADVDVSDAISDLFKPLFGLDVQVLPSFHRSNLVLILVPLKVGQLFPDPGPGCQDLVLLRGLDESIGLVDGWQDPFADVTFSLVLSTPDNLVVPGTDGRPLLNGISVASDHSSVTHNVHGSTRVGRRVG